MDKIHKICEFLNISRNELKNEEEPTYYYDPEVRELADFMHKNPEYRVLFDASKNVRKQDIGFVKEFMDRMRGDEPDDTGC